MNLNVLTIAPQLISLTTAVVVTIYASSTFSSTPVDLSGLINCWLLTRASLF